MATVANPAISVNGGAAGEKTEVVPGATVQLTIADPSGITSVSWEVLRTDDTLVSTVIALSTSGAKNVNATLTYPSTEGAQDDGYGTALTVAATVNNGFVNGRQDLAATVGKVKLWTPTNSGGYEVLCVGEEMESDSVKGYTPLINNLLRTGGIVGPAGESGTPIYINAKDYGVTGDGVTDDYANTMAAIAYAESVAADGFRPILFFPAGVYRIVVDIVIGGEIFGDQLFVDASMEILGEGQGNTYFHIEPSTTPVISEFYRGWVVKSGNTVKFSDFSIYPGTELQGWVVRTKEDLADGDSGTHGPLVAFHHFGAQFAHTGDSDGDLILENITTCGPTYGSIQLWSGACQRQGGNGGTYVKNCTFNSINVGVTQFASFEGGTENYDIELISIGNKYHSIRRNHSVYRHGVVSYRSIDDYAGPSGEYPDASPMGCHYVTGAADVTDNRPPKFVDIDNAIVINDWLYPVRTKLSFEPADIDAIRTSTATTTGAQTGVAPNGARAGEYVEARRVSITTVSSAGTYIPGKNVIIYGYEDDSGFFDTLVSAVVPLTSSNGETLYTSELFAQVVSCALPSCVNTSGFFTVGYDLGPNRVHKISNCRFLGNNNPIELKVDAVISDCTWDSYGNIPSGGVVAVEDMAQDVNVIISGGYAKCGERLFYVNPSNFKANVTISDFYMKKTGGETEAITATVTSASQGVHQFQFNNVTFEYPNGRQNFIVGNCNFEFNDCKIQNSNFLNNRFHIAQFDGITQTVEYNNVKSDENVQLINCNNAMGSLMTIGCRDLDIPNSGVSIFHLPTSVTGRLKPQKGFSPTSYAAASTLYLNDWRYDTYKITGSGTIDNIFFGDDGYWGFAGTIGLLCLSGFAVSSGGNVQQFSEGALEEDHLYILSYDAKANKWYFAGGG